MLENVRSNEVREQVKFIGELVEKSIVKGESVFIDEPSRQWMKGLVEKSGVEINGIEGKAVISDQARTVFERLGKQRAIDLMKRIVIGINRTEDGSVFGKGVDPIVDETQIEEFVGSYVNHLSKIKFGFVPEKYGGDGSVPGGDWKKTAVLMIETGFVAINKIWWALSAENEEEGIRRQGTKGIGKHLRERVMRGYEEAGEKIDESVARYKEDKDIRAIKKGALKIIFENMLTNI